MKKSATPMTSAPIDYTPHSELVMPIDLADRLARAMGSGCEIVVHDLRHPESSLVHIAGNVTGRSLGAPVTNMVLEALREHGDEVADLFNYRTQSPDGRTLRSSTLFIRSSGRVIGAMCVNLDLTPFEDARAAIDQTLGFETEQTVERFGNTVEDVLDDLLDAVLATAANRPSKMTPDERLRAVAALERRGAFLVKGGVERVARKLHVSKFTIYNYLQQVRAVRTLEADGSSHSSNGASAQKTPGSSG